MYLIRGLDSLCPAYAGLRRIYLREIGSEARHLIEKTVGVLRKRRFHFTGAFVSRSGDDVRKWNNGSEGNWRWLYFTTQPSRSLACCSQKFWWGTKHKSTEFLERVYHVPLLHFTSCETYYILRTYNRGVPNTLFPNFLLEQNFF